MSAPPVIVVFGLDLRLADHPALIAAAAGGGPVIPAYILDDAAPGLSLPGGASRWWLHGSLTSLAALLRNARSRLILRRGEMSSELRKLANETGARSVHITRRYEPWAAKLETTLERELSAAGVQLRRFGGGLLFEPERIRSGSGEPYKVFTPFWRACRAAEPPKPPRPAPASLPEPEIWPASDDLQSWGLRPGKPNWAGGLQSEWTPGTLGARAALETFLAEGLAGYVDARDRPDVPGTSRLSPHLHFGEISPATLWHAARAAEASDPGLAASSSKWLSEIGWREFSYHLLTQFPDLATRPFRPEFERFPWREDAQALTAWRKGETGYPLVDAGMRQLRRTGWMHNRVRMVAASFLVKHLLCPWQAGEAWFWDNLVDADLAANSASWQWVAGCGADAAPYFRIFNPIKQSETFDPDGAYLRRWVPELTRLPANLIHAPFAASPIELSAHGVRLGRDYPEPIVDHAAARSRALAAFKVLGEAPA